jgi:hypothetical protein
VGDSASQGNCVSILGVESTSSTEANSAFVAWKMGEHDNGRATSVDIGVFSGKNGSGMDGSMKGRRDHDIISPFHPSAVPLASLISTVRQIQLAPLSTAGSGLLGVRSQTSVSLLQLDLSDPHSGEQPRIVDVHEYAGRDLNRRPIVDFACGGLNGGGDRGSGLLIDDQGYLVGWGVGALESSRIGGKGYKNARPEVFRLRKARKNQGGYSGFAKVAYAGSRGLDAMVAFDDEVLVYDLRSPTSSLALIDANFFASTKTAARLASPVVTSLTTPSSTTTLSSRLSATTTPSPFHTICTTHDVVWVDERMPSKYVMKWAHDRAGAGGMGYDTTLSLMSVPPLDYEEHPDCASCPLQLISRTKFFLPLTAAHISRVLLHSYVNPLITCHTYSESFTAPVQSLLDPYFFCPTTPATNRSQRSGIAMLPALLPSTVSSDTYDHEVDQSTKGWLVMDVGIEGDLHSRFTSLEIVDHEPALEDEDRRRWDTRVLSLIDDRENIVWKNPLVVIEKDEKRDRDLSHLYNDLILVRDHEEDGDSVQDQARSIQLAVTDMESNLKRKLDAGNRDFDGQSFLTA